MDVSQIIEHIVSTWNAHDRAGHIALYDNSAVVEGPGGVHLTGKNGVGQFWDAWNGAFPDSQIKPALMFGEHGHGALETLVVGTHTGPFPTPSGDIPPSGNTLNLRAAAVYHVEHHKITSAHVYFDQVELLTQLGVTP